MISNFTLFKAEVKKQLSLRNWKYKDLADTIGCSVHYINSIMGGGRCSEKIVDRIKEVLGILII